MKKRFCKVMVSLVLLCSFVLGAGLEVSAFTDAADLPTVQKWLNGAAQSDEGVILQDTWAIDKTGVSENQYVLISQEGTETFRVKNYPDDVSTGNTVVTPTPTATISLEVPEGLSGEINCTLENDAAVYTVTFSEANQYSFSGVFYSGEYAITGIEVINDIEGTYHVLDNTKLTVGNENVTASWKLQKTNTGTDADGTTTPTEKPGVNVVETIHGFDSDKDLIGDTVRLAVVVIALVVVYSLIKYRRKKKEEINQ